MLRVASFDLDDTLIEGTVFQAILKHVGHEDAVARSDDLFFEGLIGLEACFHFQYRLLHGMPLATVHEALDRAPWREGVEEAVRVLHEAGLLVICTTDQPSWATGYLRSRFGFDDAVATEADVQGGRVGPVSRYNFEKAKGMERWLDREGLSWNEVVHIGNGSNDVPLFDRCNLGIAVFPNEGVAEHANLIGRDLRAAAEAVLYHLDP